MAGLNLCVLGAGVVGLTTATKLQTEFRNASVTVLAEKFHKDTTSFVAPGLFFPSSNFKGPTEDITRKWFHSSYDYWNDISGPQVGVKEISGYVFSKVNSSSVENKYFNNLLPVYRPATQDELEICSGGWKYGSFATTYVIECGLYLPWTTNKFLQEGGKILQHKVEEVSELAGKYDVVINCTGLGARLLCRDEKVIPVRGQILKVHAPWVDKFYLVDNETYIIPGFEGVTLGSTRQYESFDQNWSESDELDIKERCEAVMPKLQGSKVIAKRVGLRPYRSQVRVESEIVSVYEKKIKLVHNYGHGAYGVTAAPGTAQHAVDLVREFLVHGGKH